jgi:hypothetical protein
MDDVTPQCKEDKVDNMWLNIAQFYFPLQHEFGCEREAGIGQRSRIKSNVTVSLVRNDQKAKVLFIENKRPSKAKNGPRRPTWNHAEYQL